MSRISSNTKRHVIEATVTSKGQITLPKPMRDQMGIQTGSRIRFLEDAHGGFQVEPVLHELEDLWASADVSPHSAAVMSFEEMDEAKRRRAW